MSNYQYKICQNCNSIISEKTHDLTKKHYNKALCQNCELKVIGLKNINKCSSCYNAISLEQNEYSTKHNNKKLCFNCTILHNKKANRYTPPTFTKSQETPIPPKYVTPPPPPTFKKEAKDFEYIYYEKRCVICKEPINKAEKEYSLEKYGTPICNNGCQQKLNKSTPEAINLYFTLVRHGVPAELEKWDGYKHIDIAIPEAKLNIEVDGTHHNTNKKQAFADLLRTKFSLKKGFYTIRIPNSLLRDIEEIEDTANIITQMLNDLEHNEYKGEDYY